MATTEDDEVSAYFWHGEEAVCVLGGGLKTLVIKENKHKINEVQLHTTWSELVLDMLTQRPQVLSNKERPDWI